MIERPGRPFEPFAERPLAYLITWTVYGSWLPGDDRGWRIKRRGEQEPDAGRRALARYLMIESPFALDREQRLLVERTIDDHASFRNWELHARNCRSNHVHVVVAAATIATTMREQFKAWCSRRLNEQAAKSGAARRETWWTSGGDFGRLYGPQDVEWATIYVRDLQ
ncbi:MAG TPA: hypothetical protein VNC50_01480 [Planctomycetia bacterium]|nr:hypothetical protein [Planctomycetia bacterium]